MNCDNGQSIQTAVNNTREGGVIEVYGTCNEKVVITRGVILNGLGSANVNGPPRSFGTFTVRGGASGVRISGFNITGEQGVRIEQGASATVRDNFIDGSTSIGILIGSGSYGLVQDNIITNSSNSGIHISGASSAQVGGNTMSGTAPGGASVGLLVIHNSYLQLISANTIMNNHTGFHCDYGAAVSVVEQSFSGNDTAVQTFSCEVQKPAAVPFP